MVALPTAEPPPRSDVARMEEKERECRRLKKLLEDASERALYVASELEGIKVCVVKMCHIVPPGPIRFVLANNI